MDDDASARLVRETNFAGWQRQGAWAPRSVSRAEGSRFWDDRGREYLDFSSQIVASNLGHGNRAVVDAISEQARTLAYASPGFATPPRAALSAALGEVLPRGVRRYFFSTSGTEANEAALKIARLATGRSKILSRTRSYHGSTAASFSVSGDLRRIPLHGVHEVPGTVFAPDCYCYRCPLGLTYPDCHVACADEVATKLDEERDVAAMIVEPVVGTNGVLVPVPEYLPKIREITRRRGVLLIADEVMTGWGRVGEWFAVDRWHVIPDILTTAKGITGGYVPLGLTATSVELYEAFRDRFLPVGHTYESHPVALAAAVAALAEYRRLGLVEKSRRDGEYLLARLRGIAEHHPSVGDVRGLGLFAAVELVRDRATKEPFNSPEEKLVGRPLVADAVAAEMMRRGVYVLSWVSHLVIAPPLIVTREEIDRGVDALDAALGIADAQVRSPDHPGGRSSAASQSPS